MFTVLIASFMVVFVPFLHADPSVAESLQKQAEESLRSGDVTQAIALSEKAIVEDPQNGYLDFYAGYIYLYRTENRARAFELLESARRKGYITGLLFHRMGMCQFHLKEYETAVDYLQQSIDYNTQLLLDPEIKRDRSRTGALNREIANSFVWLTKQYEALHEPLLFVKAVEAGLEYNPNDQWLPGLSKQMLLPAAHQAFALHEYEKAIALYRQAQEVGSSWEWLDEMVDIVEQCAHLPPAAPDYTHRIGIIYVTETQFSDTARRGTINEDVTEAQKRKAREAQSIFKQIVELFSGGRLSVSFTEFEATLMFDESTYLRRTHPDQMDIDSVFFSRIDDFDTFVTISNTQSPGFGAGNFGGSRQYPYIRGVSYGPPRGMVLIGGNSGFGTLLHEFFHTIENMARISPAHGYRSPELFPEWSGTTELEYYRWHFDTTLDVHGYDRLNFIRRYPGTAASPATYARIAKAYERVPLADRLKANSLVLRAEESRHIDDAVAFYRTAVEMSPYQPKALDFMRSRSLDEGDRLAASRYEERLKDIIDLGADYPIYDFYHYMSDVESGTVFGSWKPDNMTITGSEHSWNVSRLISGAGVYRVTFLFTGGQKAATITWVELYRNGRLVSRDEHTGWSGNSKRNIVYTFDIADAEPGDEFIVKSWLKGEGGTDSSGNVLIRRE